VRSGVVRCCQVRSGAVNSHTRGTLTPSIVLRFCCQSCLVLRLVCPAVFLTVLGWSVVVCSVLRVQSRFAETRFAETRFAETLTVTLTLNPNFGETGFGDTCFGESGFGETGRHRSAMVCGFQAYPFSGRPAQSDNTVPLK